MEAVKRMLNLDVERPVRGSGQWARGWLGLRLEGDRSSGCGWRTFVNRESQKPQNEIVIFFLPFIVCCCWAKIRVQNS